MTKSRKIDGNKRIAVFNKTKGKCWYCGIDLVLATSENLQGGNIFVVEHVDNLGGNNIENLVPACSNCNRKKRTKTLDEFREWLRAPKFSERQIEYLHNHGVDVPDGSPIIFYGETL